MKILAADDNELNRLVLRQVLEGSGFEVTTANDGAEALEKVGLEKFDVVISDVLMPHMDGFQLCREMKQRPELSLIPFIFFTSAYTDPKDEELALSLGADKVLKKDDEPEVLIAAVREVTTQPPDSRHHPSAPPAPEHVYLQQYNRSLIEKLEIKMEQLERAHLDLQREVAVRRRAEQALREREASLKLAQEIGHIGSWQTDLRTGAMTWSDEMFRLCHRPNPGTPMKESDLLAACHPEDATLLEAALLCARQNQRPYELEHRIVIPNGEVRHALHRAQVIRDDARQPTLLAGTVQDVTERKQAELDRSRLETQLQQAQKMEAVGTLAGGIAHDFNNILTAILGHGELLEPFLGETDDPSAKESLNAMLVAARRATDLVKQILAFSRKQPKERRIVQLGPLVKETAKFLQATIPPSIRTEQDVEPKAPPVLADLNQIHQVLMNLCTNSVHAMRDTGGLLSVRAAAETLEGSRSTELGLRPGNYLTLTVKDTGHGMDDATLHRMFEPFFTTKPVGQGTGLGLAVVHGIIKNHEAGISVQSVPNKGTVFRVYFPAAEGQVNSTEQPANLPRGKQQCVLVVDDDASVGQAIGKILTSLGYRAALFTHPVEAYLSVVEHPDNYDLLLTDLAMPSLSGLDLSRELNRTRPDLPRVLMTGHIGDDALNHAAEHGFSRVLLKPLDTRSLAQCLAEVLSQS